MELFTGCLNCKNSLSPLLSWLILYGVFRWRSWWWLAETRLCHYQWERRGEMTGGSVGSDQSTSRYGACGQINTDIIFYFLIKVTTKWEKHFLLTDRLTLHVVELTVRRLTFSSLSFGALLCPSITCYCNVLSNRSVKSRTTYSQDNSKWWYLPRLINIKYLYVLIF